MTKRIAESQIKHLPAEETLYAGLYGINITRNADGSVSIGDDFMGKAYDFENVDDLTVKELASRIPGRDEAIAAYFIPESGQKVASPPPVVSAPADGGNTGPGLLDDVDPTPGVKTVPTAPSTGPGLLDQNDNPTALAVGRSMLDQPDGPGLLDQSDKPAGKSLLDQVDDENKKIVVSPEREMSDIGTPDHPTPKGPYDWKPELAKSEPPAAPTNSVFDGAPAPIGSIRPLTPAEATLFSAGRTGTAFNAPIVSAPAPQAQAPSTAFSSTQAAPVELDPYNASNAEIGRITGITNNPGTEKLSAMPFGNPSDQKYFGDRLPKSSWPLPFELDAYNARNPRPGPNTGFPNSGGDRSALPFKADGTPDPKYYSQVPQKAVQFPPPPNNKNQNQNNQNQALPVPTPPSGGMPDIGNLLKGLGGAGGGSGGGGGPKAPAQPCSSDPNSYAQQQQQYQSALQQYNQQLQVYNQQQERSALYDIPAPIPPTQPSPCSGGGQGQQCPNQPAQPGVTSCPQGTWRPVYSGACVSSWQCAAAGAPAAQLSCQPLVADIGMTIAISYSCANATGSSGTGFSTDNAFSGATSTIVTASSTVFSLGLTCINQTQSDTAKCDIQIAKPSIVMVVNPKIVPRNTAASIGWITSGMRSCTISSPDMADFTQRNQSNTSVNGIATTSPLTADARVVLECETAGGASKSATTTISVN